jgi:hypothetical protein
MVGTPMNDKMGSLCKDAAVAQPWRYLAIYREGLRTSIKSLSQDNGCLYDNTTSTVQC